MKTLKSLFLYAGLSQSEYDALQPVSQAENRKNLRVYTAVAAVLFAVLLLANAVLHGFALVNMPVYLVMLAINLALYACVRWALPKRPRLTTPLCYAFIIALYAFSIWVTLLHPSVPAVSTIVLLLAVPFLMLDRPSSLAALITGVVIVLCALSFRYKPASIAETDCWNAVSFGLVGIAAEVFQMRLRFRMLSQGERIRHLSRTDMLTGARNRNCFDESLPRYAAQCAEDVICVYADVNGLHELNDTKGHRAGDAMLQAVARALIDAFGEENTYRIGGDEFVCFRLDAPEESALDDLRQAREALAKKGYSLSVGAASAPKERLNMTALTGAAEASMYQDKQRYYTQAGKDRRRRCWHQNGIPEKNRDAFLIPSHHHGIASKSPRPRNTRVAAKRSLSRQPIAPQKAA